MISIRLNPRISLATVALVSLALSACASNDSLGRPAGRAVVSGDAGSNPAPVAQAGQPQAVANAPTATAGTEQQRLEMLERYDELLAELRDMRDMVEKQQFDYERLQKAYDEQMRRMDLRINENGNILAELQQQQEFTASGGSNLPQGVARAPGNTYQNTANANAPSDTPVDSVGVANNTSARPAASQSGIRLGSTANTNSTQIASNTGSGKPSVTIKQDGTTVVDSSINSAPTSTTAPSQPAAKPTPVQTVATVAPAMAATSASGRDQYDAAFEMLKQSRYNDAIVGFEGFIQANRNTDLADDARYWVGEAHYVSRDLPQAVRSFQQLVVDHPQSSRTPDALLKIGYIEYELGNFPESRSTLAMILERYPNTPVASAAAARLDKMSREGN